VTVAIYALDDPHILLAGFAASMLFGDLVALLFYE
jgi:hypothetical protein